MAKIAYASSILSIVGDLDKALESVEKFKLAGVHTMADFYLTSARNSLLRLAVSDVVVMDPVPELAPVIALVEVPEAQAAE